MLFFWEEELTRWRLLDQEEAEVQEAISARSKGSGESDTELLERLQVIEAKRRVVPSQRLPDGALKVAEGQPPAYSA